MPQGQLAGPVTVRYWAGARAAAGVDEDRVTDCPDVETALRAVTALHPALAGVLGACTLLLDGRAVSPAAALSDDAVLEVLPPFAGG
jgi:molybdopterin converting factor small subunit